MPANPRLTRAAEDSAAQLVRALRGTEYELMARQTQGYVRAQAGALRLIESFARDGMISGTVVAEYGDVLTVFGSPVARIEGDDAA